jgi:hypothetical protein
MITRRNFALGLSLGTLGGGTVGAFLAPVPASALPHQPEYVGGQRPRLIDGQPPHIDFGHGLVVPASLDALRTLWEGDDRYIAFGRAMSLESARASGRAELAAIGTMKLMLITMAFAPDRLTRFETCGWRSASGAIGDLVQGDVELPGRPYRPRVDEFGGSGVGDADDSVNLDTLLQAFCVYMVMKRDADVAYVRAHARLVCQRSPDPGMAAHEICPPSGAG